MIEQVTVEVGGEKMSIQSLPAGEGLRVLSVLARISSGVAEGIKDIPSSKDEVSDAIHLGKMVEGLIAQIDPDELPEFLKDLVHKSLVQPDPDKMPNGFDMWYDDRFSRKLDDLFILSQHIFVHNYGDPVEWIKKVWARAVASGLVKPSVPSQGEGEET